MKEGASFTLTPDGCVDEFVNCTGPNSFSSKATIGGASGGKANCTIRRNFADQSRREELACQAVAMITRRTLSGLRQITAETTSSITRLSQRTGAPGTETQDRTQVGNRTSYNDRSGDPSVASYGYRILAVNDRATAARVTLPILPSTREWKRRCFATRRGSTFD